MNYQTIAKWISWGALGLVLVPCLLAFAGVISLKNVNAVALAGTLIWFVATPMWMSREPEVDDAEVEI